MLESQSDDSSAASSGDEMLNFVPFSQEISPARSINKHCDEGSHDVADKVQSGMKRKHDEVDDDIIIDEAEIEKKGESLHCLTKIHTDPKSNRLYALI